MTAGAAGHCEVCGCDTPTWRVLRRGDAVVSWGCDDDIYAVLHRLQRAWEVTELVVTNSVKLRERNAVQAGPAGERARVGTSAGHGYAWPRPDGVMMKCGGPALCADCSYDRQLVHDAREDAR